MSTAFCETMCSDFSGPYMLCNPVNRRATIKYWLMVSICNMSRYITIMVVENLTKIAILKTIQQHKYRFGETKRIYSDRGTNYVAAQKALREDSEDFVSESVMEDVKKELRSTGTEIVTRAARAPWIQGSSERAIGTVKKLWPKVKMGWSEVLYLAERVMYLVNSRPLSMSNLGVSLSPNDLKPIMGETALSEKKINFLDGYQSLQNTIKQFERNWEITYQLSITRMKKWMQDSVSLSVGDLILCTSIRPPHKTLCLVDRVIDDTAGRERYFELTYTLNGRRKKVTRAGNDLVLLQTKQEREEGVINDSLDYLPEENFIQTIPKILNVKFSKGDDIIQDI